MNTKMELNERQIEKILASVEIEDAIGVVIKEIVRQDTDQIVMLAEFRCGNSERKHLAYVNYKKGYPTTDQVFDSIYGIGRGSNLRIIIVDNQSGYDNKNPTATEWAVRPVMDAFNEYQANLALVQTNENRNEFQWVNRDDFDQCRIYPELFLTDIPSTEQFRAEEFWSFYFDSYNECFYEPWTTFQNGFRDKDDWGHKLYMESGVEIPVYWKDDGVKYVIRGWHDNYGYFQKGFCAAWSEIFDRYGKENVSFRYSKGALEVVINYSVIPFSWLINATPSEKVAFAEKMHADVFSLRWRLQEIYEDMNDMPELVAESITF